jgi:hypothetical protein
MSLVSTIVATVLVHVVMLVLAARAWTRENGEGRETGRVGGLGKCLRLAWSGRDKERMAKIQSVGQCNSLNRQWAQ